MPLLFVLVLMASSAKSVVETQVEAGEAQIYQSVETTVNGETIKKESNQPGKLELEMEKNGEKITVVTTPTSTPKLTPTPAPVPTAPIAQIIEFIKNLLSDLTSWFK